MKPFWIALLLVVTAGAARAQVYYVYVAAESEDEVALVRFDSKTGEARVAKTIGVGTRPVEIEGPYGLTVDPEGDYWYVSLAHGQPYGKVVKYATGTDELVGAVDVGLFPATMQVSTATGLLYVVNANLHGAMEPSSVSVVDPATMTEVARTVTGLMPHGSRLSPDGLFHYSVAVESSALIEMDAVTFEVTRRLNTATGETMPTDPDHPPGVQADAGSRTRPAGGKRKEPRPTWVQPHPSLPYVYVADNGTDEVVEVDLETWSIARRFKTWGGPYNLDVSSSGQYLLVTQKRGASTGVIDLEIGQEVVRINNSRQGTHGVAIAPDGRYAFVSVEGAEGEPGAVDVIDMGTMERIATVEVGKQAGGIAFWKAE